MGRIEEGQIGCFLSLPAFALLVWLRPSISDICFELYQTEIPMTHSVSNIERKFVWVIVKNLSVSRKLFVCFSSLVLVVSLSAG